MRHRTRLDRLTRGRGTEATPDEVRAWADEHGVYLAPDRDLAALHREHRFHEPTRDELSEWAEKLDVDLGEDGP